MPPDTSQDTLISSAALAQIRRKHTYRAATLFFIVALLVIGVAFYIKHAETKRARGIHAQNDQGNLNTAISAIERTLQVVGNDLRYLVLRFENARPMEHSHQQSLAIFGSEWTAFTRTHPEYGGIRWIDETGAEQLRVGSAKTPGSSSSGGTLIEEDHIKALVAEKTKMKQGDIMLSPLSLKQENGRVRHPHQPRIYLAARLIDNNGNRRGILVLDFLPDSLLLRLTEQTGTDPRTIWLINQDGYWLKGNSADEEFGFLNGRKDLTMAKRFPAAWQKIRRDESGQFETAEGLWTFTTLQPAKSLTSGNSDQTARGAYIWKAVVLRTKQDFDAGLTPLNIGLSTATALLLMIFLTALWRTAQSRIAEDRAHLILSGQAARLRSLVETIPDLVWLKDTEGLYLSCNPAFERFVGASEKEIIGKTDFDFVDKGQAQFFRSQDRAALQAGRAITNEEWITYADDKRRVLLETTKVPVKTASGELIGILGIARDITTRKQVEDELRKSNYLLTNLTANIPGVIFQLHANAAGRQSFTYVSEAISDICEITPEELRSNAAVFFSLIHPDDRSGVQASMNESAKLLEHWRREFRVALPKHGIRWLILSAIPEMQNDRGIVWYGMLTDITERKLAEGGLQLATMVYQNSSEAIIVTDNGNTIIAVNPAFERITGYSAQEALGQSPSLLKSGRHDAAFYEGMWSDLLQQGSWQGELWNRRKDGSLYATRLSINTTKRADGTIHYFVGVGSDITQRKETEKLIWRQANYDALTSLPNRNKFRDHSDLMFKKSLRSGLPTAVILLDLDNFKDVNDTLGHHMGDVLLQEVATRLRACVRESDIVARLGGDEFTVLIGEIPDQTIVERISQKILDRIAEPFMLKEEFVHISASVGITYFPRDGTDIDSLLKNADQAMYAAKRLGRNRSNYFDPSMQEVAQARMKLIGDMRNVLDGSQFALLYQPIIELSTGDIHHAEALIRWKHPQRGTIKPIEFIRVAEETGMIVEIGNWVIGEAVRQVAIWRASHHREFQISVNVSPVQLRGETGLLSSLSRELLKHDAPGRSIVIEITEGVLLEATPGVRSELLSLREAGIQVAIDDFGTGYSALSYLKKFNIDFIKIDRSFVANLAPTTEDLALCEAIIAMAHTLNMKVIAEGVETVEQRNLLTAIGCDFAQGHLFSVPLPAHEFDVLIANTL